MNSQRLIASNLHSRKVAHQERVRKIAVHVLGVAEHRVKVAARGAELLDSIKGHVSDNSEAYIGGAAGAVTGGAIGAATGSRGKRLGRAIAGALIGGGAGTGIGYGVGRLTEEEFSPEVHAAPVEYGNQEFKDKRLYEGTGKSLEASGNMVTDEQVANDRIAAQMGPTFGPSVEFNDKPSLKPDLASK